MATYILRRLLLMIPTLFGIMALTFAVIQFVPGGPVERMISLLEQGAHGGAGGGVMGGGSEVSGSSGSGNYRGRRGLDPEQIEAEMGDLLEAEDPFVLEGKKGKNPEGKRSRPTRDETLYDL